MSRSSSSKRSRWSRLAVVHLRQQHARDADSDSSVTTVISAIALLRAPGDDAAALADPAAAARRRTAAVATATRVSCHDSSHHGHQRRQERDDVVEDELSGRGEHRLHPADVVGEPALDLARARAREERQGEALQVVEQAHPQGPEHLLADLVGEPGLGQAEGGARRGEQHHQPRQEPDPAELWPALDEQPGVEDPLDEQGVDDADGGARQDQHHRDGHAAPVRPEQRHDPRPRARSGRCTSHRARVRAWRRGRRVVRPEAFQNDGRRSSRLSQDPVGSARRP